MSLNWEMTEQDFEDVKHLLPHSVVAMITVIGLEATFHMVKVWGGTNYPISNRRRNTRQSRILHAQLVEDIGEEAAGRLERAYVGQPFWQSRAVGMRCANCATGSSAASMMR